MPVEDGPILEFVAGGNFLQIIKKTQTLLTFNAKPGLITEHDLRKDGAVVRTKMIHNEEVTAVCMDQDQTTLVIGFKDGTVKIMNSSDPFEVRETIQVFMPVNGKKGTVSQLKIHPSNGALFGCSLTGLFKLIRLKV